MNGRNGPPPAPRRSPDPRVLMPPAHPYGPPNAGRFPPIPNGGGRFPPGGRGHGRFGAGRGRFDGRGQGRMPPGPAFPTGRGMNRPLPPPPPGRGFYGRGMPGRGPDGGRFPPGRGPPMQRLMNGPPMNAQPPPLPMRGAHPRRIPPPPPPPPPPGRGPMLGRGMPVHHGPPGHTYPGMPPSHAAPPPVRQHSGPLAVHPAHAHPAAHSMPPQHSVQTAPAPATTRPDLSAYTQQQIDQGWTEHTAPNSTKYYYNSITQESTYTKPACLNNNSAASVNNSEPESQQAQSKWAEYTDPSTGKKYYSDGVTTTWERPAEMGGSSADVESEGDDTPKRKKRRKSAEKEVTEFNNSAEATAAFKGLLLAKNVLPTTKWNEVVKMCSSDSRWEACEVLSLGERKQALAEYQTKRANELRTMERQERMRAKEVFVQLLTETLPSVQEFSATNSQFLEMRSYLAKDDRFYAVEKEETRESLFLDFCEEVRKRDERKKRSKKREARDNFLAFLKECEEHGTLTFASTWASFVGNLDEGQRSDPRFQLSPSLPDSDRELCFADYVLELQAAEEERRRRIRDAHRKAEKAQKEAFTEALRRMASEGTILPSSRWRNVESLIAADPAYAPVQAHERDSPRELFEDFVHEWNDVYRRDRSFLSNLAHSSVNKKQLTVQAEMHYDEYTRALLDQAAHSPELYSETRGILNREDPISSARLYFNELLLEARESEAASKRSKSGSRRCTADSSSEDEGEIREDGEVKDDEKHDSSKKGASDE